MSAVTSLYFRQRRLLIVGMLVLVYLVLSASFVLAVGLLTEGVDPLPQGCIGATPPGEDAPICCLSGFVYVEGQPVDDATITIADTKGVIGTVYTQHYRGLERKPYYYLDLTKLSFRSINATQPITPGNVITLTASYNGITTQPITYMVQPGGQRFNFNLYNSEVRTLNGQNTGVAEIGKFQSISGVDIDSEGNLYLWDSGNYRMLVLQPDGNRYWLDSSGWQREPGFLPYQVRSNTGIAIDRNTDNVYFNDRYKGPVEVYNSQGKLIRTVAAPQNIISMGFGRGRNLYAITLEAGVVKYGLSEKIEKEIKEDELVKRIGKNPVGSQTDRIIAISPQGDLFVARKAPNAIFKFDSNLQPISFTVQLTSGLPLSRPIAMTVSDRVDNRSTLYVFDQATYKLYAFDADTGNQLSGHTWLFPTLSGFSESPSFGRGSELFLIHYRDRQDKGLLYLVSQYDGVIFQLPEKGGTPMHTWGGRVQNPGSLSYPEDIAIAPDNSLFFADSWTGRISRMVNDQIVQSWSMTELGLAASNMPIALAFDQVGNLLVTTDAHKIHRFIYNPIHSTLQADVLNWGDYGSALGQFYGESGVTTDKNGFVFITELGNRRVQVLRQEAAPTGFVAITSITVTGVLSQPFGIAVDDRSEPIKLYVSDTGYRHIVKFTFDRFSGQLTYIGVISHVGTGTGQFGTTNHLDVDDEGYLWVADHVGYRVHRINPDDPTNPDNGWQSYGTALDPAWYAHGIAITKSADSKELLYVGSRSYGLISSFTPMAESDPLATIVHCSDGDLTPGMTLTCMASGQDGDATNLISRYKWSTDGGLSIVTTEPQVVIPTTIGATSKDILGSGLHTLWLHVRGDEGNDNAPDLDWSQPVSTTIYVAPQVPTPRPTGIPTPNPVQLPPPLPATCPTGWIWTMLLYLDADNKDDGEHLLADYHNRLDQLKTLNHPCVRIAVQIDGPASIEDPMKLDTERWLIHYSPTSTLPVVTQGQFGIGGSEHKTTESEMDNPETLIDFIKWGQKQSHWGDGVAPTNYYYLAIADHGNAFQGIAFDHTTAPNWNAYLDAKDLRTALTAPGIQPIHILHLDACSMALLDVAYQVREQVDYLIASQYIGWSFFAYADYASYINQWTRPEDLAKLIVDRYATLAEARQLPYTLSALNLTRIEPVKTAIDGLAEALTAWVGIDSSARQRRQRLFDEIRNAKDENSGEYHALFFDSNSNYLNTPRDAYIDLLEFVQRLQQTGITEAITQAATKVIEELESPKLATSKLILHERHSRIAYLPHAYASGAAIDLQKASGVSLYYPVEGRDLLTLPQENGTAATGAAITASTALTYTRVYSAYIGNQLFDFTTATQWGKFLVATYGAVPTGVPVLETVPPLTVPAPIDNSGVTIEQYYQLEDVDNNGPSTGDRLHFTAQINNQNSITLTDVVLVQLFDQPVQSPVNSAQFPCTINNPKQFCQAIGIIGGQTNQPFTYTVTLTTNTLPTIQAILYVDGSPLGELTTVIEHRSQLYLPLVMTK